MEGKRGRPKAEEASEYIRICFKVSDLARMKREAKAAGVSLSAYVRLKCSGTI